MPLTSPRFTRNARLQQAAKNQPPLRVGDRGEAVAIVQLALIDLGFAMPISAPGGKMPDGIYGKETASVVREFQRQSGLAADGIAGKDTLAALERRTIELTEQQARTLATETRIRTALR
jgi:peptidoglycan hydrolase-like protein with peptidoglycan-binding domain